MKRKFYILIALIIVSTLIFFLVNFKLVKGKVLVITNTELEQSTVYKIPEKSFVLTFIHSVHHTPVYEYYKILDDNTLLMEETRFFSLGVGMPFTDEGGVFKNEKGEFVLKFNREFENLYLRISPIPQHAIIISGKTYPLLDFAKPEQQLKIEALDKWYFIRS